MSQYIEIKYLPPEDDLDRDTQVVKILPVRRNKYQELLVLSRSLLTAFINYNCMPGDTLNPANERVWVDLNKVADLLPIAGGGKLDLDLVSDEDIVRVFFTTTTNRDEVGSIVPLEDESFLPSEIARVHGFNFFLWNQQGLLQIADKEATQQRMEQLQ